MTLQSQEHTEAQETESLRHQISETRSDLGEKLESLENLVGGMVQSATDSVTETIESVKETVGQTVDAAHDAVQDTVTSVKHAVDIRHQIRQHPWLMLGAVVGLGYICGNILFPTRAGCD